MAQKVADIYALFGVRRDSSWGAANTALKGLERGAKVAAVAAAGALYGIKRLVEGATENAAHLVSYSAAMGLSIEKTQEWGYVAEQSGSNLREMSTGINMFLRNLKNFSEGRGGKALASQMRRIGIDATYAKQAVNSPQGFNSALLKTADVLKGLNETQRATFTSLFGTRVGKAIIADMARGSDGILAMQRHYRELGAELSGPQAMNLRQLGNDFNDVKIALGGLVNQAIAEAAPAIHELTQALLGMLKDPEKRQEAIKAISGLIKGAAFVAQKLAEGLLLVGKALNWMLDHKTAVEAMMIAIFSVWAPLKFLSVLLRIRSVLGGLAATKVGGGLGGLFGGAAGVAGTAAGGLGAPAAAGVAGAFPAAAAQFGAMAVVRGIAGALVPAIGLYMLGSALDDVLGKGGLGNYIDKFKAKKEREDANEERIGKREAIEKSNAAINADYRALYGHAAKVDPFALQDAAGGGKSGTANTADANTNVTITNGPIEINVTAPGANDKVGEAVADQIQEKRGAEYRAALDAVGGKRGVR